jgi:hypothetical protein
MSSSEKSPDTGMSRKYMKEFEEKAAALILG